MQCQFKVAVLCVRLTRLSPSLVCWPCADKETERAFGATATVRRPPTHARPRHSACKYTNSRRSPRRAASWALAIAIARPGTMSTSHVDAHAQVRKTAITTRVLQLVHVPRCTAVQWDTRYKNEGMDTS